MKLTARLLIVVVLLISLSACSTGFQHRLPVRQSYKRVKLGEPIPQGIKRQYHFEIDDTYSLVGLNATHEWKYSTGATEWAIYLLDGDGLVVAKRYIVDGDEVTIMPFHMKRISEADWSWLMHPAKEAPYLEARETCAKLRLEVFGWKVTSYDIQAMSDDATPPISADTILDLAEGENSPAQIGFEFKHMIELDKEPPVIERSLWQRLSSNGGIASMSEYRRLRLSGAQMTAMGWAHSARTGELP